MRSSPFILLCTTGLFAIFSSTIAKSPVLPLFAAHIGAEPSGIGLVASASAFTGIIASIPAGMLSDKIGRKKMLILSASIFATAPFSYLFITHLWQLVIARFYHGFATALFIPVAMAYVSDIFHKERGEKIGWFSTATLLGRFIAPIAGGSIIGAMAFNPTLSYKTVYMICGASGVIALFFALKLPAISDKMDKKQGWQDTLKAFKSVASNKIIIVTSCVEAAILFAYGTFETFIPLYAISVGLSAYEVGVFISAQIITLALTKPMMGKLSDRHGRESQIFAGAIVGGVCIVSFPFFKSFVPLLLLSILFGLSLSIVTSATSAFIADISKRETHGSAMGILGSIMDIGHTTGPLVSGILITHFGFGKAFLGASAALILVALIFRASLIIKR